MHCVWGHWWDGHLGVGLVGAQRALLQLDGGMWMLWAQRRDPEPEGTVQVR